MDEWLPLDLLVAIGLLLLAIGLPIVAGIMLGRLMSWRLFERIGAGGRMLIVLAVVGSLLPIAAGTIVAQLFWPTDIGFVILFDLIGAAFGTAEAARRLLAQDYDSDGA